MNIAGERGSVLVLAPHEPTLDPRVHYTAESLAKTHAVIVVAIVQESDVRPDENRPVGAAYETVRIPYRRCGFLRMSHAFLALWASGKIGGSPLADKIGRIVASLLLVVAFALAPALVAVVIVAELLLVPVVLLREERLLLIPRILRALRKAGSLARRVLGPRSRGPSIDAIPDFLWGIRVTIAVLRFTFAANYLLWRYALEAGLQIDTVYCHDLYSLQAGLMLKQRSKARVVYDSHEYYPYQYQFWCHVRAIRFYESVLVRAVDAYVTVSPQLAEELGRVYGVGPVHTLPNVEPYPASKPLKTTSTRDSEMSRLANGRIKLLYQGTFAEGRGLEEVLQEWTRVDGTKIALFLRGPGSVWREQLKGLAEERGLLGLSVYILPPVLEKDLIAAAREADIGLIPYKGDWLSYRFACPNKLSQYIHAGLAILSNNLPYVEQTVRRGECGLCYDVRKAGSFANAVGALAVDRILVDHYKGNALAFSQRDYNWERFEPTLLKLVDGA